MICIPLYFYNICENNWIRRIAGVWSVERRIMKDLREEVGTKACIVMAK